MSAYLILVNRGLRPRRRTMLLGAAAIAATAVLLLWIGSSGLAPILMAVRAHLLIAGALTAIAGAVTVARHRVLKRAELARSWLRALPVRPANARWESLIIETLPAWVGLAALALLAAAVGIVLAFVPGTGNAALASGALASGALASVWGALSAGWAGGAAASYAIPAPKPEDLPPGSRYVPRSRARRAVPLRPSLAALGLWPIRRMFSRAQPKMIARALLPIYLCLPMGTMADAALLATILFVILGAVCLLVPSVISVGASARDWLAPLPVRMDRVLRLLLMPSSAVLLGAGAGMVLPLRGLGVSWPKALIVALCIALMGLLAIWAGAWLARSRRMKEAPG